MSLVCLSFKQLLFANVHQLLNEFRPWQAREDLIQLMEAQIARRRATIRELQESMEEVCKSLQQGLREVEAVEQAETAVATVTATAQQQTL